MTARHRVSAVLVVAFEVWLYTRYAALGLVALTVLRLARRRTDGGTAPWEAGWLGQLYSVFPDILFLAFGVLHMLWMDVFALHISLHFVPRPLVTMWVLFTLSLLAYGFSRSDSRRLSALAVAAFVATGAMSLALARDLPVTLGEVRGHDGLALMCPVLLHTEHAASG